MLLSDLGTLAVLSLYEAGWAPEDIDDALSLADGCAAQIIADDATEFPSAPLRVLQ